MKYEIVDTPSGAKSLILRAEREIRLHSLFDPVKEAERAVAAFDPGKKNIIVAAGTALGYHLPLLRNKFSGRRIIALDKDSAVIDIAKKVCPENFRDILTASDTSVIDTLFETMDISTFHGFAIFTHRPSYNIDPSFYDGILTEMNRYVSLKISDLLTRFEFEEKWAENIIKNMPCFFRSSTVKPLFSSFRGMPGIIVSAGPSLKKNARLLEKARDKALICCVDTSFKVLYRMGISPHIVMTLDVQKHSLRHFLGISDSRPLLIADMVSFPKIAGRYPGNVAFSTTSKFYSGDKAGLKRETTPLMDWIEKFTPEIGDIQSGGSVATSLFDFLLNAGCSSIVLIGQDLAYTGREIHTAGTYHNDEWLTHTSRLCGLDTINQNIVRKRKVKYVSAWGGGKVITDYVMDLYKQWFEDSVKKVPIPVINATEGGSHIDGAEEMPFAEWIAKTENTGKNPDEIIKTILASGVKPDADLFIKAAKKSIKTLSALSSLDQNRYAEVKKIVSEISDPSFDRLMAPFLKKTNAYLNRHPELTGEKSDEMIGRDIIRASRILEKELSGSLTGII